MKIVYLTLCLLSIWSCSRNSDQSLGIIKVDPERSDSTLLSNIAVSVNKVILETTSESLISYIIDIKITNQIILVNDNGKRVLEFDHTGKFIRQIGKQGRGPGEYDRVYSLAVDSVNQLIFIASYRKIMCFDYSGKQEKEFTLGSFPEFTAIVDNKLWTISTIFGAKPENGKYINITQLFRYTLEGNPIDTLIINKIALRGQAATLNPKSWYISDLGKSQFIYYPVLLPEPVLRDTIYEIKSNKIIPSIKLDFGDIGKPKDGKKRIYISYIFRTRRFLFAAYNSKMYHKLFCYDFSGIKYNADTGFRDDIYNTGKIELKPLDLNNNKVYFTKEAFEIAGKFDGITENSNPVVFIVCLKDI